MPLASLATVADLEGRLGRTFTVAESARATLLLADASAAVRAYTGQQFTAATSTVRLAVRNGAVRLPQRPVSDVDTVVDTDANDVTFTWHAGDVVHVTADVPDSWAWEPRTSGLSHVDVTYTHGYDEIPAEVVAVVCQIAGRAFGRPADQAGVTQESIDDYSYAVGAATAAGGVGMLRDEKAALDRYRRVVGTAWVGGR